MAGYSKQYAICIQPRPFPCLLHQPLQHDLVLQDGWRKNNGKAGRLSYYTATPPLELRIKHALVQFFQRLALKRPLWGWPPMLAKHQFRGRRQ